MGRGIASVGGFLAFAAFIVFLLASVSTPIIDRINYLEYEDQSGTTFRFGTFGWCRGDECTEKKLGYNIDGTFENISGEQQEIRGTIQENLTYALVLVPVVCGMSFIAFLFSFGGGACSGIMGSIWAFLTFLVSVIALGITLGIFVTGKNRLGENAELNSATWLVLAGTILILLAAFTICCSGVRERRQRKYAAVQPEAVPMSEHPPWYQRFMGHRV